MSLFDRYYRLVATDGGNLHLRFVHDPEEGHWAVKHESTNILRNGTVWGSLVKVVVGAPYTKIYPSLVGDP